MKMRYTSSNFPVIHISYRGIFSNHELKKSDSSSRNGGGGGGVRSYYN